MAEHLSHLSIYSCIMHDLLCAAPAQGTFWLATYTHDTRTRKPCIENSKKNDEGRGIEMKEKSDVCATLPFFLHSFVNFLILYAQLPSIFLNLLSFARAHIHTPFTTTISFTFNYFGFSFPCKSALQKLCVDFPLLCFKENVHNVPGIHAAVSYIQKAERTPNCRQRTAYKTCIKPIKWNCIKQMHTAMALARIM